MESLLAQGADLSAAGRPVRLLPLYQGAGPTEAWSSQ